MSYRYRLLFLLIFGVMLAAVSQVAAQSSLIRWSQPARLGVGWFPAIMVDQTDTVHIAWHGGNASGSDDLMWYTTKAADSDTFQELKDVIYTGSEGFTIRVAMDVTSDGILYAMYRNGVSHAIANAPVADAHAATQWQTLLSDFGGGGYYLDMLIDRHDVIHAVSSMQAINVRTYNLDTSNYELLRHSFPCALCSDLIYRRSEDRGVTWSEPMNISQTTEGSDRVNLHEGRSGRLYISWSEGTDWYVGAGEHLDGRFAYSDDGGKTWSDTIIISGDGESPVTQLALTETEDGAILVVWRYAETGDTNIYYQLSYDDGSTWTEPETIPDVRANSINASSLDQYELVVDLTGVAHLFAVGFVASEPVDPANNIPKLLHLEYRQGRWLAPYIIYDGLQPEWPAAVIGPKNELYLSWFVRVGNGGDGRVGDTYVYFAEREANMLDNPVLVAYAPTLTPLPPPTKVPEFEPTATAFPTLAPVDATVDVNKNQDLYAIETFLGATFAVSVLCIGALFIFGFRPRL